MKVVDFGSIDSWRAVEGGVAVMFEADNDEYRQVDIDVIAPSGTEAQLIVGDMYMSLGEITAPTRLRFGVMGTSGLVFDLPEGAFAHVRTKVVPMIISETGAVPLTKAEPRRASGVEQEMRRLMLLMEHRSEARIAEREREFERRLRAASAKSDDVPRSAEVIEEQEPGGDK